MAEDFPKRFHCPKCGSEKTVVGMALAPLKASGEVPLDFFGAMEGKMTTLKNPQQCKVTVPVLITHWDTCFECGSYYCTKVEKTTMPVGQFQMPNIRFGR